MANIWMKAKQAHSKIQHAVDSGKVTRPETCEICGQTGWKPKAINRRDPWTDEPIEDLYPNFPFIVAHHPDYNKPLEVMWLCGKCHRKMHEVLKAASEHVF